MIARLSTLNPVSRRIQELMEGHTDREEESEIISLLTSSDAVTLNQSLNELDLAHLFNDVDDRIVGPDNKTRLLNMLSEDRLDELQVPARAAIVDGLQRGPTTLSEQDQKPLAGGVEEQTITKIFLGTGGPDLTGLKNTVNAGADEYDMHSLLFSDVDDSNLVGQMFGHFQAQESGVNPRSVKPLSDIDDTFYSSLKDKRFPGHTVYPGVLAFYDELDRGPTESDPLGDLTFLTARPDEVTGIVKSRTHRTLRENGVKEASLLLGSLTGLINHEAMARKKMENFEDYTRIYPEYDFTWVGDSGQGDAILGEMMLEKHPEKVKGVFIHDVVGLSPEQRDDLQSKGVHVFDTYLGAAVEAHELGLMSDAGLSRVADAAKAGFQAIEWDSDEQRDQAKAMLQRDLERLA
jgi:uncharacterized protein DUF2183